MPLSFASARARSALSCAAALTLLLAACGGGSSSNNGGGGGPAAGSGAAAPGAQAPAVGATSTTGANGGTDGTGPTGATGGTGGTGETGTTGTTDGTEASALDADQRRVQALAVWREADPGRRSKGSCVGCHGADFFDLARIGTLRETTIRRATVDGATPAEAALLADAIDDVRRAHALITANPQTFRPFQPGGALLPGDTSQARDVAFGRQLQSLLPTLMGSRIATLAQARQARDELIDIAYGRNDASANPQRLDLRSLPVGIPFPQWSADAFNGSSANLGQTTLNDWISDVALEPTDDDRPAWLALQQAYLAQPSNANFWRLFAFVDRLQAQPAAYIATLSSQQQQWVRGYTGHKYRSALIGQQLLRSEAAGTTRQFLGAGPVAFNYLLDDDFGVKRQDGYVMPQSHLWDVADYGGRSVLQASIATNANTQPVRDALAELGFPAFVQTSTVAPDGSSLTRWQVGDELRLSWFWLGLTLDPSLFRIGRSGATQGGEYINATLASETYKLFLHDQFSQAMRAIARTLPETGFRQSFDKGAKPAASEFYMGYYLIQYHPGGNGLVRDDWVTPEQKAMYTRLVNNTHRMYLLLYADVLSRTTADRISQQDFDNVTGRMRTVFRAYEPQTQAEDEALIENVRRLGGF